MATTIAIHPLFFFFFFFFMVASSTPEPAARSRNNGFSIEIIPFHSHSSPFYNPSDTFSSRIRKSAQRSLTRLQYLHSSISTATPNEIQSPVKSTGNGGEYLMKLSLGSTGFEFFAIIDTGSDLVWTQCIPCDNCYSQPTPMFDPSKSSSYTNLDCSSSSCKALPATACLNRVCRFRYSYQDGSSIMGVLATDTLKLDSSDGTNFSFSIAFGCGHNDSSQSIPPAAGGLVGLGRGPNSLISQLGSVANGKFSYCFMNYYDTVSRSTMNFGLPAIVSGDGLVTTPLTTVTGSETFYYLTLDDISVGSQKLNIPPGTFHVSAEGYGGLVIDSGTTVTYLNQIGYNMTVTALESAIKFPVAINPSPDFQVCYQASNNDIINSFPRITFHFLGGNVIVGAGNIFVEVDGLACLAVFPISNGSSVYGNLLQQGFHVGYDLVQKTVSFAPADCTRI